MYSVKEIFYTLQGEGAHTGRAAVFCRFAGCNLWSGLEHQRSQAVCQFCDTDFIGTDGERGGKFNSETLLVEAILECWKENNNEDSSAYRFVVLTGGEPLLQVDAKLIEALNAAQFNVAIETNGTQKAPSSGHFWLTVSPKSTAPLVITTGNELKLVYPQSDAHPKQFEHLSFEYFFLQPMDCLLRAKHTLAAIDYCKQNPKWKLSLQTHKILGIP
jgi:7-carboxy-7-deazaguanine synthase